MKRLLLIIFSSLFFSNTYSSEKSCKGKIDLEWNMYERKDMLRFYFKSSCEHPIYMNYIYVSTESGKQEIKRKELNKDFIRSYGVAQYDLYIGDVNQDIVGWGGYGYSLNPPKKVPSTSNSTTNSNNWNNNKSKNDGSNWFGLLVAFLVVGGIAMMISKNSSSKTRSRSTPKTYTENYKETYSEPDNSDSSEIMPKPEIQRRYKIIAKFYNNYRFIDYGKIKNKKVAQKQMEDIVNVVDKNLSEISAGTANTPYRMLIVGMVTFKLLSTNQIKKVHKDLGKMYELGQRLQFDDRLMNALRNILDDNAGIDY